jgi:HAD superfamily hydrolase (TIGR01509 family)
MDLVAEVDLVVFDFDGVVADSEVISLTTLREALQSYGISLTLEDVRARFLGTSLATISGVITQHTGSAEGFAPLWQQMLYAQFRTGLRPVAGISAVIARLKDAGIPVCIASSSSFERIHIALEAMQMTEAFQHIFSAEQVARGKPAPDLFQLAARSIGVAPERCLVVEDSPFGIQAARAAGMRSVGFVGGSHLDGLAEPQAALLEKSGAEAIINAF